MNINERESTRNKSSASKVTITNSRDLTKIYNPYTSNAKEWYCIDNTSSNENIDLSKKVSSKLLRVRNEKNIRLTTSSEITETMKQELESIIFCLKEDIKKSKQQKSDLHNTYNTSEMR